MKLKKSDKENPIIRMINQNLFRIKTLVIIIILFFYSIAVFWGGVLVHRAGYENVRNSLFEDFKVPFNSIKGLIASPKHIIIDIKHIDFQRLAYQREMALTKRVLMLGGDDYVTALISYKDKSVKVKMRLKGDWIEHIEGDKWSFRIKVKGDNTLFGMKQFSIHQPKTRNYIYEWLFQHALKREGVLGLRYEFIKVTLNGKDLGIYALEEHFEKRLIEHNQLREGPIVRFNENLFWHEMAQQYMHFPKAVKNDSGSYLSSDIDAFQTGKLLSDPNSTSYLQYVKAINLLESFRRGKLKTSEVFDIQKLAKFFAITDLMGAEHGSRWHNTRFYYNPITSLLEPIGFDGDSGQPITELCATKKGIYIGHSSPQIQTDYYAILFNDPIFFQRYTKTLERISNPSYLNELLAGLNDELQKNLRIIYKEFPEFHFSKNLLYRNQRYIRTVLNPVKGIHAHYHKACKNQIELELGNIQQIPIEALNLSYKDSFLFQPVQGIILPAKLPSNPVAYQHVKFILPQDFVWEDTMIADLKINYRLLGTSRIRTENVFPWPHLDENFRANDFIRQQPNIHEVDFLIINDSTETIFIKPGIWNLDQNLIIPKGYKVVCSEGVQLNLSKSAKILSYSPLEFIGSEAKPIFIHSADATGQGIAVMNAKQTSVLEYVIFSNLSNPSQSGWELTGAITFYESPVNISRCQFVGNSAEDSLNIVRSEFTVDKTVFRQTPFDAFDADFTKGKIITSSFVDCGNDAIDVSGSVIELQNIFINGVGDKGLSVGENSQVTANQIEIKDAAIALASKDMSKMDIENVNISDAEIGFTAYQKKSEFGPASITANNFQEERVTTPYLIEAESILIIDEVVIESNHKNINELVYGSESGQNNN